MGDVTTGGSTSGSTSPQVDKTANLLLKGLQTAYKGGVDVYGKPLYTNPSATTNNAWSQGTNFSNTQIANGGLTDPMRSAVNSFGDIGTQYGAIGQNGGLTSGQSSAMSGLGGIGSQYAGLGGLSGGQQSNLDTTNSVGNGFGALTQNGGLSSAQSGAMGNTAGLAGAYGGLSGAYDQNAPGYATLRQNLLDDAAKNVGAGFTSSGRFGGGSYINDATTASLNAIAPLDYQNYQNGVNNKYRSLDSQKGIYDTLFNEGQSGVNNIVSGLTGQGNAANQSFNMTQTGRDNTMGALTAQQGNFKDLFDMQQSGQSNLLASLMGQQSAADSSFNAGQTGLANQQNAIGLLGQIGASQDANSLAQRTAAADLFDRTHNADWNTLARAGSIFSGTAPQTTQQTSSSVPWWAALLGGAATGASLLG